jgi:hypothetical protein
MRYRVACHLHAPRPSEGRTSLKRQISLAFACVALISFANSAFALDGNDVLKKLNALYAINGIALKASNATADGDTVTLTQATATGIAGTQQPVPALSPLTFSFPFVLAGQTVPLGDVTLKGVKGSEDGGYEIEKASFQDIGVRDLVVKDIYIAGISVPGKVEPGTLKSMMLGRQVHIGTVSAIEHGRELVHINEVTSEYDVEDQSGKAVFKTAISGVILDPSIFPDRQAEEAFRAFDIRGLGGNIVIKGSWTPDAGKLDIDEYSVDVRNIGRIEAKLSVSGCTQTFMKLLMSTVRAARYYAGEPDGRKLAAVAMGLTQPITVNSASVRFTDSGITDKVLGFFGRQQGMDGKQFARSLGGLAMLWGAELNVPELLYRAVSAASVFLDDPKSIEVYSSPVKPIPVPQIIATAMGNPVDIAKLLDVEIISNQEPFRFNE